MLYIYKLWYEKNKVLQEGMIQKNSLSWGDSNFSMKKIEILPMFNTWDSAQSSLKPKLLVSNYAITKIVVWLSKMSEVLPRSLVCRVSSILGIVFVKFLKYILLWKTSHFSLSLGQKTCQFTWFFIILTFLIERVPTNHFLNQNTPPFPC